MRLAHRIARDGPITVAEYMAIALTDPEDGYYRRANPLGAAGDFTTAPEISQLFGELIGAWLIDCWDQAGRPSKLRLVELGPGRGTLMADIMRVARRRPDWLAAVDLHLVEINTALRTAQAQLLSDYRPHWHDTLSTVPDGPVFLLANEFLDALPIRQLVFWEGTWRERLVDWSEAAGFHFVISPSPSSLAMLVPAGLEAEHGSLYELSPSVVAVGTEIAQRVAKQGGAAILIDYGRAQHGLGDSFQAVQAHRMVPVLDEPGHADLSAHVDFAALLQVAEEAGTRVFGPASQGSFLKALGIGLRGERLKKGAPADIAASIDQAIGRLVDPAMMGQLFKVLAVVSPGIAPAGFDPGVANAR